MLKHPQFLGAHSPAEGLADHRIAFPSAVNLSRWYKPFPNGWFLIVFTTLIDLKWFQDMAVMSMT
jgi:hypothetical protein